MSHARLACQVWSGEATQQAGGVLVGFLRSAISRPFPEPEGSLRPLAKVQQDPYKVCFTWCCFSVGSLADGEPRGFHLCEISSADRNVSAFFLRSHRLVPFDEQIRASTSHSMQQKVASEVIEACLCSAGYCYQLH